MGCDGGTIPKRDELVRTKKKPEQKDKNSELAFKWKNCAISQEALVKPLVACELGRLYNKESILEFLLDRSKFEVAAQFDHIRGLKDIKELNLTDNPECRPKEAEKGDGYVSQNVADFICPVVGLEMTGKYKFCFLWSCGCVVSERALKEVKTDTCHKCGKHFSEENVVLLNGTDEDVTEMRRRMEQRRALQKSKRTKKTEKHKLTTESTDDTSTQSKKICLDSATSSCASTSSASNGTKSKLADSKLEGLNSGAKSLSGSHKIERRPPGDGSIGNGSSIQKDPHASKTFKSLFTSSAAAKNQKQAHWVTYNPMYF